MEIKNVLIAINVRWWNAEAAYALNVARGLTESGSAVWVIVNRDSPVHLRAQEYGIPVLTHIWLDSMSPIRQWLNYRQLSRFVEDKNITIINSFKSNGSFIFNLIRLKRPFLTYIRTRGEARPPKNHFLNSFSYGKKACDGIIAAGDQVKRWLYRLNLADQNIHTIHYGDSALIKKSNVDAAAIRSRLQINDDALVLALLGRAQRVKGHLIMLSALAKMSTHNIHLLFLVKDLDEFPEELQSINEFITHHGLKDQVTILGFQEDLHEILSCVDFGVIPSTDSEVNCRVAVEFFSLGIPVMAFPTGSLPELISHKTNGYLCAEKSEQELIRAIQWILDNRFALPNLGTNARKSYQDNYTLEQLAKKTLEFYRICATRN